jgi:hypothetical protein
MRTLIVGWVMLTLGIIIGALWKDSRWIHKISDMTFSSKCMTMEGYAEAINDLLSRE